MADTCATPASNSSKPAPRAERRCSRSRTALRNCLNATSTRGAPATRWRYRFETATARAGICRYETRTVVLSVSYVLRAPWHDIRDTLLHEIAHAIIGPGHSHDVAWQTAARRIRCTAKRCSTVMHSLKRWMRESPGAGILQAMRERHCRQIERWPLTATTREPACQDASFGLMIDSMATGTGKRPPTDLRRPRGRQALSTHPPAPVDATTSGSLEQRAENKSALATRTAEGLRVNVELDDRHYPTGITMANEHMNAMALVSDEFHGDWNYKLERRRSCHTYIDHCPNHSQEL